MRVLTVGNMYPPHHLGGYELVWRAAVEHLRAAGHEVRVLTSDHREPTAQADDADVHRELRWYWRDHEIVSPGPWSAWRIERHNRDCWRRHVAEFAPDVVAWWAMGGLSMGLLEEARRAGLPAVAFVHDDWLVYGPRADGWRRWLRRLPATRSVDLARAARLVFVSEATRERAARAGVRQPEAAVAHSGIESAFLTAAAEQPWEWRLLCVGRIDPRKGIETAVRALAELPAGARLTVVGDGDARERGRLQACAARLGVAERVTFAGALPRTALPAAYAAADAVVFPVLWDEPWGLVPLEAMGIGRPVVATGRGGSAEYLRDGENCLLSAAGDAAALAAALRRLADEPALRARLRAGGLPTAAAHTEQRFNEAVEAALLAAAVPTP